MASPVTPAAGLASEVTTGETAVITVGPNPSGGFILNPASAADQGLGVAEPLYVDPVQAPGGVDGAGNGTTFAIQPGGTWDLIPGQTTPTWVNSTSGGHKFSVVYWP